METWQIEEKHWNDTREVHKKLGHLDGRGRIRRFNGALFFPEMAKLGHSTASLDTCTCRLGKTETPKL